MRGKIPKAKRDIVTGSLPLVYGSATEGELMCAPTQLLSRRRPSSTANLCLAHRAARATAVGTSTHGQKVCPPMMSLYR
jgi:hypothetical protein